MSFVQCCTSRGWRTSITNLEYVDCESSICERRGYPEERESLSEPLHTLPVYRQFSNNTDPHVRSFYQRTPETHRCGWATASFRFVSSHWRRMVAYCRLGHQHVPLTFFVIPGKTEEEMPPFKKCLSEPFLAGIREQVDRGWAFLHQGI